MRKNLPLFLIFACFLPFAAGAQCLPATSAIEDFDIGCAGGCHLELNDWPDGTLVSIYDVGPPTILITDTTLSGTFGDGLTSSAIICIPCDALYVTANVPPPATSGCLIVASPPVLAVTLSHFAVSSSSDGNTIIWTVNMEQSGVNYIIQRSADCSSYTNIALIRGTAYGDVQQTYSYTDPAPPDERYCYRLKAVEPDGTITYSQVGATNDQAAAAIINVYPNPVISSDFKLSVPAGLLPAQLTIANTQGQILYSGKITITATTITSALPAGIYLLTITGNNNRSIVTKLIKQ